MNPYLLENPEKQSSEQNASDNWLDDKKRIFTRNVNSINFAPLR